MFHSKKDKFYEKEIKVSWKKSWTSNPQKILYSNLDTFLNKPEGQSTPDFEETPKYFFVLINSVKKYIARHKIYSNYGDHWLKTQLYAPWGIQILTKTRCSH